MDFYDLEGTRNDGEIISLSNYRGKVLLVVNVASRCGFTSQYEGLQHLYREYRDLGFEVLAFPCDQFGRQEPGSNSEIKAFCETNFGVSFPLFAKIKVNGPEEDPLYSFLKSQKRGFLRRAIHWNFSKFLIDRQGNVVRRYASSTPPGKIAGDIEELLARPA